MKKFKRFIQILITLTTAVGGGVYIAKLLACKQCEDSLYEFIGWVATYLLVVVIIAGFWLWLFSLDQPSEEKEIENE